MIQHLADQAAGAVAHMLSYAEAQRLARINNAVLEAVTDAILLVDFDGRTILENSAKLRLVDKVLPYGSGETIWSRGKASPPTRPTLRRISPRSTRSRRTRSASRSTSTSSRTAAGFNAAPRPCTTARASRSAGCSFCGR